VFRFALEAAIRPLPVQIAFSAATRISIYFQRRCNRIQRFYNVSKLVRPRLFLAW